MKETVVSDNTLFANTAVARIPGADRSADSVESELMVGIASGNRFNMAELYLLYFPRLARFFSHVVGNDTLIEDLIGDTMIELWRENATLGSNTHVAVWVMGIAYRHARKRLIELASVRPHEQPSAVRTYDTAQSLTVESLSHLDGYLRRLTVDERAVFSLVYGGNHSPEECVSIMNMSRDNVKMHLSKARLCLRSAAKTDGMALGSGNKGRTRADIGIASTEK